MGTSGAYGGSGKQCWGDVRTLFDALPGDDGGANATQDQADSSDSDADVVGGLAEALGDALADDDSTLTRPPAPISLGELLPPSRGSGGAGGGGGGGGVVRGTSSGSGRVGAGSKRSVTRAAARGGAAIGGAFALRTGDRAGLAELGLDLDELRGLGPRAQSARILDAVLGEGGHPDETALRAAAAEQLKVIVIQETPLSEADALRAFISAFVFQMALVELRADLAKGVIDTQNAVRKEGRLKRYIKQRVSTLDIATDGHWRIADFSTHAERLVREAIALLRAR